MFKTNLEQTMCVWREGDVCPAPPPYHPQSKMFFSVLEHGWASQSSRCNSITDARVVGMHALNSWTAPAGLGAAGGGSSKCWGQPKRKVASEESRSPSDGSVRGGPKAIGRNRIGNKGKKDRGN